jgi:hypothetical protein
MSLLDLLDNFGKRPFLWQEVDLHSGRLDLFQGSGSRFVAAGSVSVFSSGGSLAGCYIP